MLSLKTAKIKQHKAKKQTNRKKMVNENTKATTVKKETTT